MASSGQVNPAGANQPSLSSIRAASIICLICGIWLFISPWVYGFYVHGNAWNSWIVGGLIVLWAVVRLMRPAYSTGLSWYNTVCGIWVFCSPWIFGYTSQTARFINSLCVGIIVIVFSIVSARLGGRSKAAPVRG